MSETTAYPQNGNAAEDSDPMPRPKKWRNVCCLPGNHKYGPLDRDFHAEEYIAMTVEEYETIRLIDYMGMIQEECAERMGVARTTVQDIYSKARLKMAKSLIEGIPLIIEGGQYKICEYSEDCQRRRNCRRNHGLVALNISEEKEERNENTDTDRQ